jgi:hypothetical protein
MSDLAFCSFWPTGPRRMSYAESGQMRARSEQRSHALNKHNRKLRVRGNTPDL